MPMSRVVPALLALMSYLHVRLILSVLFRWQRRLMQAHAGSEIRSALSDFQLNPTAQLQNPITLNVNINGVTHGSQPRRRTGLRSSSAVPNDTQHFGPGVIIYAPHHCTALNPKADPTVDPSYAQSEVGVISSKRRMMLVSRRWVEPSFTPRPAR